MKRDKATEEELLRFAHEEAVAEEEFHRSLRNISYGHQAYECLCKVLGVDPRNDFVMTRSKQIEINRKQRELS